MSIGHVSGTMVGLVEQKRTRLTAPALLAWPASQERLIRKRSTESVREVCSKGTFTKSKA